MHKNEQICEKCAINYGIEGNAGNENITKYKNLCGIKSISNSVQRLARNRFVALISIERLCIYGFIKLISMLYDQVKKKVDTIVFLLTDSYAAV